jgi:hypothetical protein
MNTKVIRARMRLNVELCRDSCGEVNHTQLAETVCNELDGYEGDEYNIPEEFFEIAVEFQ